MAEAAAQPATQPAGKVNWEDIQLVQKLIERCLELYMSQQEIVTALKMQANIEPGLTNLGASLGLPPPPRPPDNPDPAPRVRCPRRTAAGVWGPLFWGQPRRAPPPAALSDPAASSLAVWEKLQEQNPDFFRAYRTRLRVKGQIREFNQLVSSMSSSPDQTAGAGAEAASG